MSLRARLFALCAALSFSAASSLAEGLTPETLVSLKRIGSPVASPDGSRIVYTLRSTDLDADRGSNDLWMIDLTSEDPSPRQLTDAEGSETEPQWSADGAHVYFLSSRSGSSQVYRVRSNFRGNASKVTDFPVDVTTFRISPDGTRIAFSANMYPACPTLSCTAERVAADQSVKSSGTLYTHLFVRHWDTWEDTLRSTLLTAQINPRNGRAGEAVKVSGALDGDVPGVPFGGRGDYVFSPDGATLYFVLREAGPTEPLSTDLDLYATPADGSAAPVNLTHGMDGTDTQPVVSPDGRTLAFSSMERPGYESDKHRLMLLDLSSGEMRDLTARWDRSVSDFVFTPDGSALIATAQDTGTHPLFRIEVATGDVSNLTTGKYASSPVVAGNQLVYAERSLASPDDLYAMPLEGGEATRLTAVNADMLAGVEMAAYEQFSFAGAEGERVYAYAMKPAGFVEGETYPIAFIIHGGPQGSYSEGWSYRWNPQTYAGAGYGVVFVDFHGSTGYGQAFTDAINNDWGGKPLTDLKLGLAAAIERYDWLDGDRACALGASYGGYMVNWIAGNWPDRFDCLVNHDGLFDLRNFYYATEELWFPEWDFSGPYFERVDAYERWNPANHVTKWQTPMLVIHGERDYRVTPDQGLAAFTALQRQGIESELLIFPDENHWVLKPNNSIQWHNTVLNWLDRHLKAQE